MDVREQFGLAMQRFRRARGLSQEDLAGTTEIDRAYIGRLERGVANPTLLMLARIAEAFEVSLAELFRGVKFTSPVPREPKKPALRKRK